ncbi:MAG: dihydroxyacetone kinase subunit DhaL [Rhodopila sp.]|jgi:dihydroxyacetone kinase-like protein
MTETTELMHRLIDAVTDAIITHAPELTALDQAIGDGDHGINMKRGFEAVRAEAVKIAEKPLAEGLGAIGMQLVMKVGGASGPLYGTLFMTLGKTIDAAGPAGAFAQAVAAVKARGKSGAGQKTMLDVLVPVQQALEAGGPDLLARLPLIAAEAAEATVPMKAIRGRASFLGDRSIGHMDPGARSASIMLTAICRVLGG